MPLTPLNQQLTDLGGIPVLWDSDLGTLVQDPTQGGTNRYGPGDLFRDPANGDLYQLQQDGSLALYRVGATVPTVPVTAGVRVDGVSSAGKSWTSSPTTGLVTVPGDPQSWSKQLITWLSAPSSIGHMPNWTLVALAAGAYTLVSRRRRRNPRPILRNPGKGERLARRAERARRRREELYIGPYIREQRAAMRRPSEGRLGRFERSFFLAQQRRRQRR